jgi:hypothetical protein
VRRSDFLRSVLLAPLAALAGCKSTGEATPIVLRDGTLNVPTTWTCDTATTSSVTIHCNGTDDNGRPRWVRYVTNGTGDTIYALAGNHLP